MIFLLSSKLGMKLRVFDLCDKMGNDSAEPTQNLAVDRDSQSILIKELIYV